jgi:hypothetical protein
MAVAAEVVEVELGVALTSFLALVRTFVFH